MEYPDFPVIEIIEHIIDDLQEDATTLTSICPSCCKDLFQSIKLCATPNLESLRRHLHWQCDPNVGHAYVHLFRPVPRGGFYRSPSTSLNCAHPCLKDSLPGFHWCWSITAAVTATPVSDWGVERFACFERSNVHRGYARFSPRRCGSRLSTCGLNRGKYEIGVHTKYT